MPTVISSRLDKSLYSLSAAYVPTNSYDIANNRYHDARFARCTLAAVSASD